jgi:hypothetical protein
MRAQIGVGLGLIVLVTAILAAAWGSPAILPGVTFGLLALMIEVVSVAVVRPVLGQSFGRIMARRGIGMGLRFAGIALFVLAVVTNRVLFAPFPTAFGYLGVLVPLLFMEPRFLK